MQTTYLINHSLEFRLALSIGTAVVLFAIVRAVYFLDAKLTAFLKQRREMPRQSATSARRPLLQTTCAAASAR